MTVIESSRWSRKEDEFLIFAYEFTNVATVRVLHTGLQAIQRTDGSSAIAVSRSQEDVQKHIEFLIRPESLTELRKEILEAKRTNARLSLDTARKCQHYLRNCGTYTDENFTYPHLWQ